MVEILTGKAFHDGFTIDYTITLCKDKAGLSAKPRQNIFLNIDLITKMYTPILTTPLVCVVRVVVHDTVHEVIIHQYGELLFKGLLNIPNDLEIANTITNTIFSVAAIRKSS